MLLHKNQTEFKALISTVADYYGMKDYQIEKDYYVSLFLKHLSKIESNIKIVFKGGTSLSKCYQVIDRFSEDIDLAVAFNTTGVTQGERKKLKEMIVSTINHLGMNFINAEEVRSRRDHNIYHAHYTNQFDAEVDMTPHIMIETIVAYQPYPCIVKQVSNYITGYLISHGNLDILERFDLFPFEMVIQSIERTFIDKLFAICDYHLEGNYQRYSRHIYDVHMIWQSKILNLEELHRIVSPVVKDRQVYGDRNLSCRPGVKPVDVLIYIIESEVYKKDYIDITSKLINNPVLYETCIESLRTIVQSSILPLQIRISNV